MQANACSSWSGGVTCRTVQPLLYLDNGTVDAVVQQLLYGMLGEGEPVSRVWVVASFEVAFVGLAVAWRTAKQRRDTGSTGFVALRERGRPARVAAIAMVLGVVGLAGAPAVAYAQAANWDAAATAGVALMAFGLVLTLVAQQQMGRSWRIGVDPDERTELVTAGVFGSVRNPIFTGMIGFALGAALAVPNAWSGVGATLLTLGIIAQVLLVEEPYLRRVHGRAYADYASSAGRFLPRARRSTPAGDPGETDAGARTETA